MSGPATVYAVIARNLREFGYGDVSGSMIRETHEAMLSKRALPHGVIGMFAKDQITEAQDKGLLEGEG